MRDDKIKIKLITETAKIPFRAHDDDTGYDVFADSVVEETDRFVMYGCGFKVQPVDPDVDIRIFPRSSVSKRLLSLANSIGLVDNGYRGEVLVVFYKLFPESRPYGLGDKIAQLVPTRKMNVVFAPVDEVGETVRGKGKWGSTGT